MSEPTLAEKLTASRIDEPVEKILKQEPVNTNGVSKTPDLALPSKEPVIGEVPSSVFDINDQKAFHTEINNDDSQRKTKDKSKKPSNLNIKKSVLKGVKIVGLVGVILSFSYVGWSYWENRQKLTVQEDTLSSGQINLEMKLNELEVKLFDSQSQSDGELAKLKAKIVKKDNRLNKVLAELAGRMNGLETKVEDVRASGESNDNAIYGLTVEAGKIKKLLAGIEDSITKSNLRKTTTVNVSNKRTKPKRTKPRGPVTINNINGYTLYSVDTISGRNKIVLIKGSAIRIIRKGEEFEGFSVKSSSRDTQIVSLQKNSRTYKLISG